MHIHILQVAGDNEEFLTSMSKQKNYFELFFKIKLENKLIGNILFIHSGGGLSLFGFQEKLQKALRK